MTTRPRDVEQNLCPYCELGELDSWRCCSRCEELQERESTAAYFEANALRADDGDAPISRG